MDDTREHPAEGLTVDGRYVTLGNQDSALSDQIICGMDKNGDIIRCAEIQPVQFIEQHWYERFDFDEALFANYGKDWWLGLLYWPARKGLLGRIAQSNVTEAGDEIKKALDLLWANKLEAYLLMRAIFRVGLGIDEHEAEIEQCLSGNPQQLSRFRQLNAIIDQNIRSAGEGFAKRVAGGAFVGFALRRVRIPRKYLTGAPAVARRTTLVGEFGTKMTMNFVLAGWGAMMRTYMNLTELRETRTRYATSWQKGRIPSPMEFLSAAIFGERRAFSLTTEEMRDLLNIVHSCEGLPEELQAELDAFSMLLDVFITFCENRS